jgi:hypothetical protein
VSFNGGATDDDPLASAPPLTRLHSLRTRHTQWTVHSRLGREKRKEAMVDADRAAEARSCIGHAVTTITGIEERSYYSYYSLYGSDRSAPGRAARRPRAARVRCISGAALPHTGE